MDSFTYSLIDTPVGTAVVVASNQGVVALRVIDDQPERSGAGDPAQWGDGDPARRGDDALARAVDDLSRQLGVLLMHDEGAGHEVADQLGEYFAGERTSFDIALDWRLAQGFHRDALQAVCTIPYAESASYGEVAVLAGRPRAARAVGTACRLTPFSVIVPVHRVIRADGTIGEYGARPDAKRFLIDLEQVRLAVQPGALISRSSAAFIPTKGTRA